MTGFVSFRKCLSSPNHLIKLLVVIGCICFSVYQVGKCVEKLLVPPITTYYGFRLNETMSYPSVTICRRPGYKTANFPKYGLRRTQSLLTQNVFRSFNFDGFSIRRFLNETTYGFDEVVGSYAYNGFGAHLAEVDWMSFETISYGKCFSFTPKVSSSTYSISGGYWFYLNHDMTYRLVDSYGVSQYGYHVYVHDANEIMTSEYEQDNNFLEYIYIEALEDIRLHLRYQKFHRVHTSENPCIDPTVHPSYSRSRCLEECFYYQVTNRTNCTLPWLWLLPDDWLPQCSTVEEVTLFTSFFLNHNRRWLVANCSCPKSCHVTIYTPTIISRKPVDEESEPHSFLAMYYTNNLVTEMKEVVGYNINGFVSDIGGSLGFLLGLSVIGFIRVLEQLVCSVIKTYFKKKTKPEDEQQSETHSDISSNLSGSTKLMDDESPGKYIRPIEPAQPNLYENLRDFDSDDFKYYERTLIAESSNRF